MHTERFECRLTPGDMATLDQRRGPQTRSAFVRDLIRADDATHIQDDAAALQHHFSENADTTAPPTTHITGHTPYLSQSTPVPSDAQVTPAPPTPVTAKPGVGGHHIHSRLHVVDTRFDRGHKIDIWACACGELLQ